MDNDFSKEERVAFEEMMEGFEDALVISRHATIKRVDQTMMERTGDTLWFPQPYILPSYAGRDQTGNFNAVAQLSTPMIIGYERAVPWQMSATELRDALQEGRLGMAAKQRLASDINTQVMRTLVMQGTIVTVKTGAASLYDDIAAIEGAYNRVGIAQDERYLALTTADYNGLAANLAGKADMGSKMSEQAYKRSYVGPVAGFETYKLDTGISLLGASGGAGITMNTLVAGNNFYVPVATVATATGRGNVDNRYDKVTVSSTTNVRAGDAFTIAGVEEVHHITKEATGVLKTFRVISVDSATEMTISPPIISAQGATVPEIQYQNCSVSGSATAAIVFLNTTTKGVNVHWHKDALVMTPGRYSIPQGAGVSVIRSSTSQGIEVSFVKWVDGKTLQVFFRLDIRFGVSLMQPEMAGITLFSQT
jgi:hypothetical protein